MPKFDGGSLGGDLAYDFTDFGHPDIVGVVPEPSRFAAKRFFKEVQRVFKELNVAKTDEDTTSPDQIVEVMNAIDDEEMFDKLTDGVTDCLARLCGAEQVPSSTDSETSVWVGGSPTHSQLNALGYRPFMGFFGYLMQNLMNPELQASATTRSPGKLRSV
ncbi:MAG TPA: hypothetical protein VJ742_10610 [Nitrososphaera sp.]|nr:hypothetical protein [Nitrososphaera sp.]